MFGKHRDEFNAHANFGPGAANHGASANFAGGRIHQQLDGSSGGRGILRSNEETAHAKVSDIREEFFLGRLPGKERAFRRLQARMLAQVDHRAAPKTRRHDTPISR
jgi:hypothetical protein